MDIKAAPDVLTVLGGRLNKEPGRDDVTGTSRSRKHYVAELLFRAQLVEGRLLEELHCELVEQI